MTTPHSKRRPRRFLQFSLRSLLVFVLLVSIGMSWLGVKLERARRQREAVEAIDEKFGPVGYDGDSGWSVSRWARAAFREDFFFDVDRLMVCHPHFGDEEVVYLRRLPSLTHLELNGTAITDAGLEHLKQLTNLTYLALLATQVTPEGVKKLQEALPECQIIYEE